MNKVSLLAGVAIGTLVAGNGYAADLSAAPPRLVVPAPWTWSGLYVGANLGGIWAHDSLQDVSALPWLSAPGGVTSDPAGVIGGLQAGYNWQFSSLVLGIEGDVDFASASKSLSNTPVLGSNIYRTGLSALGTIRGRFGFAFDRVLVYATGGVAFANLNDKLTVPSLFTAAPGSGATGWTVGAGAEFALTDHWTAKAEYLFAQFPNRTTTTTIFGLPYTFAFKDSESVARVGINYKF